ncbi:hypothetical protein JOD29_001753 [Lysinibacillus composti]|nr:hypothetical protein [Lysinibacillus composti]
MNEITNLTPVSELPKISKQANHGLHQKAIYD